MESLMTFITVMAGMSFSLVIALATEELIFGKVLCPLFARNARLRAAQKR